MAFLRAFVERVLLLIFGMLRIIFILQALSVGCALAAVFVMSPPETPAWFRSVMVSILLLAGTYLIAGVAMIIARRWRVPHAADWVEGAGPRGVLLPVLLLALPTLAAMVSTELPPLWSRIAAHLQTVGFWDAWARGGSNAGAVLIPIFLSLFVPVQVTAAALFSIVFPLALLALLVTRSRLFSMLWAMGAVCQTALVLAGWLATDSFARLAAHALSSMRASGDIEVLRLAGELERATGALTWTATALAGPLLGTLALVAFLRPSSAAAAFSREVARPTPAPLESPLDAQAAPGPGVSVAALQSTTKPKLSAGARPHYASLALAVPGALMLLFGAADGLRSRPSFVSSQPAPGATLGHPPASVRITLDAALDPSSSVHLTLLADPASGGAREVGITQRLATDDAGGQTLEAIPAQLSAGLYRVAWHALPARGGVGRHGSFSFGVGVPVPADTSGATHSLQDRDAGARGRQQTIGGGVLLLILGALSRLKN